VKKNSGQLKLAAALVAVAGLLFLFVAIYRFVYLGGRSAGFWLDIVAAALFLGSSAAYLFGAARKRPA